MRYPALDGLRGFAALLVVLSHFSNLTGMWGGRLGNGGGQIGVMLFFLISGFLMGRLYLGEEVTPHSVLRFVQRRIARVVPLYLLVVLASFVIASTFGNVAGVYPVTIANLFDHLLFLSGVSVLWSIPVEVHFYMLFLIIWLAAAYCRPAVAATALIVAAAFCLLFPRDAKEQELLYYLHFFLAGVGISIVVIPQSKWWDVAFCALAFAPFLIMPRMASELFGVKLDVWRSPVPLIVLTMFLVTSLASPLAGRILGSGIGRFAGEISYSVYLLHTPLLFWLTPIRPTNKLVFLSMFLAAVVIASWATYRLIELPIRTRINALRAHITAGILTFRKIS